MNRADGRYFDIFLRAEKNNFGTWRPMLFIYGSFSSTEDIIWIHKSEVRKFLQDVP